MIRCLLEWSGFVTSLLCFQRSYSGRGVSLCVVEASVANVFSIATDREKTFVICKFAPSKRGVDLAFEACWYGLDDGSAFGLGFSAGAFCRFKERFL